MGTSGTAVPSMVMGVLTALSLLPVHNNQLGSSAEGSPVCSISLAPDRVLRSSTGTQGRGGLPETLSAVRNRCLRAVSGAHCSGEVERERRLAGTDHARSGSSSRPWGLGRSPNRVAAVSGIPDTRSVLSH
jgi:hypothetical protein